MIIMSADFLSLLSTDVIENLISHMWLTDYSESMFLGESVYSVRILELFLALFF